MQTVIVKWGNSQGVRLPKILLESANLNNSDVVDITVENNSIVIKKSIDKKKYRSIQERFNNFNGSYDFKIIDWGKPIGKEIW